jgi:hypothetical protein
MDIVQKKTKKINPSDIIYHVYAHEHVGEQVNLKLINMDNIPITPSH